MRLLLEGLWQYVADKEMGGEGSGVQGLGCEGNHVSVPSLYLCPFISFCFSAHAEELMEF